MGMSIAKAQARLLAGNFLDDLGSSKEGLQARESFSELIILAAELVEDMQFYLEQEKAIASGKLSESIEATEPQVSSGVMEIDILMAFYGRFINKGVKGTRSGSGLYQFQSEFPSRKMVEAVRQWLKQAKRKERTEKRTFSALGRRRKSLPDIDRAYAKARAIKLYGIKARGFVDKAVAKAELKVRERFGAALKIDIINSSK